MSDAMDAMETVRAARDLGDSFGVNEKRRQEIGRAALAKALGEPRLANLRPCSLCGLLDDTDPCGDHTEGET